MSKVSKNRVILKHSQNNASSSKGSKKLFAYVVDKKGDVIEIAPLTKGEVALKTNPEMFRGKVRVFITGKMEGRGKRTLTLNALEKVKAYEPSIRLSNEGILDVGLIPDMQLPFLFHCKIVGSVKNHFTIDGEDQILPIDDVRVHICEVDPWFLIIKKVPDYEIADIRDKLLGMILREKFPPIPFPPGPWPPFKKPIPGPKPPVYKNRMMDAVEKLPQEINNPEGRMMKYSLPTPSENVISGLSSQNLTTVRKTLELNYQFFYPYFCWYPFMWPFFYRCDHIATVSTDCSGRFDYSYNYYPTTDKPDIYVWVEAKINGSWTTVYKPWKVCGTHWNYVCGTEINITLNNPNLSPSVCDPIIGQVVWIKQVNSDGINIRDIQQSPTLREHLGNGIGLTSYDDYEICPFAKSFPLVVQFGSGFPSPTVKYYRWRYRRIQNANLANVTEDYAEYDNPIHKHYTYEKVNSDGDTVFYTGAFKLGPEFTPNGPVYKIPHVDAVVDVPGESTARWNQNTYSIQLNTVGMSDGLYEFIFELLNSAGNVVSLDPDVFVVTKKSGETSNPPDATTISADDVPENYLLKSGVKATGFRFVMRIDNQVCTPIIQDALVDGINTNPTCGFAQYADKATSKMVLKFYAKHQNDFAEYRFWAVKGNGPAIPATKVIDYVTQVDNGYVEAGDIYSKELDVNTMLGSCDQAAFAESLFMYATHTNGNRRIHEYDGYDSAAFAIEPAP